MGEYESLSLRNSNSREDENKEKPLFPLGGVMLTRGAVDALMKAEKTPYDLLVCHQRGDWGELCEEDIEENKRAITKGLRICSRYPLETGAIVWVITEWDRNVTTLFLPEEF